MEKRFVLFVVAAMAVIFGHLALRQLIAPPPPRIDPDAQQVADGQLPDEPEEAPPDVDQEDLAADEKPPAKPLDAVELPERETRSYPQRWATLGSYGPNDGQSLLATFNSRGATAERIELTERADGGLRYASLEDRSGYLGHLALTASDGNGCRVNAVGAGTPAALALPMDTQFAPGLRVGDVLTQIDDAPLQGPSDFTDYLHTKKPEESVTLTVQRDFDGTAKTAQFSAQLGERPLDLIRPEPLESTEFNAHPLSFLLSLVQVGERKLERGSDEFPELPSLRESNWDMKTIDGPEPAVEFRFLLEASQLQSLGLTGSLEIVKRFRLGTLADLPEGEEDVPASSLHHLWMELEFIREGGEPLQLSYRLDGPNGLPLEGWWYSYKVHPTMFRAAGARDILCQTKGEGHRLVGCPEIHKYAEKNPKTPNKPLFAEDQDVELRTLRYAAVDSKYFLAALVPQTDGDSQADVYRRAAAMALGDISQKRKGRVKTTNTSFQIISPALTVVADKPLQREFLLYTGPKEPEILNEYGLGDCLYYGWFEVVARPLSHLLHFFYGIVRNYGLAIIMLTILVRGCMFPLGRKAAKNAAMMQELAPEMRQIAEKYKKDMEKRAKAQQDLFRKHKYNPFGGCWLMFLQLPIFIGLYRSLAVDIRLRQAPLIPGIEWCSNLAGPDKLYYWEWLLPTFLASETGMLGPFFNILPLVTTALFLVHQKLFTPPATDDQTRMQMQMMKFMTLFIGFLFFKVASGLCLYFIASSLWSVAERKLLPKSLTAAWAKAGGKAAAAPRQPPEKKSGSNGSTRRPATRKRQKRR